MNYYIPRLNRPILNSTIRMTPNFYVVGAQKCATTSLHHYLFQHPEIFVPQHKETKFFVKDIEYQKGFSFYLSHYFSRVHGQKAVGEVDPDYMFFENAIDRMVQHINIEMCKFIFIFRNPINRAISHYLMTYRRGYENLTFDKAIISEKDRINRNYYYKMHFSYLSRGLYYRQVIRFLKYIDKKQMHFILVEDLQNNPVQSLKALFDFLNVSNNFFPANIKQRLNKATVPINLNLQRRIKFKKDTIEKRLIRLLIPWSVLRSKLRAKILILNQKEKFKIRIDDKTILNLKKFFEDENQKLSAFIDRDLTHWDNFVL